MTTYVFIPGGGHGGWAWLPVATRVHAAGHVAVPTTLPGMGSGEDPTGWRLEDAVSHVVEEIVRRDLDAAVLVAHSFGGIVMSAAAARLTGRIAELIYVSAHVPIPGQSFAEARTAQHAARTATEQPNRLSFENFRSTLMQDEPEAAQRIVYELLTPTPPRYLTDTYDGPAPVDLGVPVRYLLAEHDRALPLPGRDLAARLKVEPIPIPGTHEALLTHPDEVTAAILRPCGDELRSNL